MASFDIMINEEQRDLITKALKAYKVTHPALFESTGAEPVPLNPGEYLIEMFEALKDDESNYGPDGKHMLHGFCL